MTLKTMNDSNLKNESTQTTLKHHEANYLRGVDALIKAPMPKSAQYLIVSFLLFIIASVSWASFSNIDIVSSAVGKSVPSSRIQLIQAPQLALIESIYVKEGQRVEKGELLVKLDRQQLNSQYRDTKSKLMQLTAKQERLKALLVAVESNQELEDYPEPINSTKKMEYFLLHDSWSMYQSERASMLNKCDTKKASLNRINADMTRLKKLIPFSQTSLQRSRALFQRGGLSQEKLDESREALVERMSSLDVLRQQKAEANAELDLTNQDLIAYKKRFINDLSVERVATEQALREINEEVLRASAQINQFELRSPMTGIAKDVIVNTLGGVVQAAETLMKIVPENVPLEVEAKVLNRDIGFIYEGQEVKVKVDTFNFTKYGSIPGVIRYLAQDTTNDEQLGPIYLAIIELERDTINIGNRTAKLVPGMTMTVDIHVGQRKLMEYVLNPVLRYQNEVMRER